MKTARKRSSRPARRTSAPRTIEKKPHLHPKYWRERADEARQIAFLVDRRARDTMLHIADLYDKLAEIMRRRRAKQTQQQL